VTLDVDDDDDGRRCRDEILFELINFIVSFLAVCVIDVVTRMMTINWSQLMAVLCGSFIFCHLVKIELSVAVLVVVVNLATFEMRFTLFLSGFIPLSVYFFIHVKTG